MHRLEAAFLLVLVLSARDVAFAQTNPTDIRDGCVTGNIPSGFGTLDVDLFTVAAGTEFVLTDLQYRVELGPSDGYPRVVDEAGTTRWFFAGGLTESRSWATGIRFTAGKIVRLRLSRDVSPNINPYFICWSGYVSPSGTSSVSEGGDEHLGFKLGPNPTGGGATLWFRLDRAGPVTIAIYDTQGRLIHGQKYAQMQAGERSVRWDGRDLNGKKVESGVYFARLEAPGERHGAKIVRVD